MESKKIMVCWINALRLGTAVCAVLLSSQLFAQTCVPAPPGLISWWSGDVDAREGISNSVDARLDAAFAAIIDANENNNVAACNALDALAHFVEVQWGNGRLTDEQALYLLDAVDQIIELLCPA